MTTVDRRPPSSTISSTSWSPSRATPSTPSSTASGRTSRGSPSSSSPGRAGWRSSTRWPSTRRRCGGCSPRPALAVAHAAQQDLDVLTHAVGADPAAPVRHPGRGRLRRLRHAVAVVAAAGRARDHAGQGRPADRLAAPAADRRPARVRRRRRRLAARAARPPRRRADRARPAGVGRGRVRGAALPADRGDRPARSAWLQAEGRPLAAVHGRGPSPRPSPAWREREAAATDTPVRQVLPDLAVLGIAQRQPTTLDELAQARGVDERHRRGRIGRELLAAVAGRQGGRPAAGARRRRRARPLASARPSRWCRRGSARSPATPASTPPCWPRGPTWSPCSAATPTPACARAGGPSCSATASPA